MAALASAAPAGAHDYWLQPDVLETARGRVVRVSLLVGEGFVADERKPFDPRRTTRLLHVTAAGASELRAADQPTLPIEVVAPGGHLVVLDRGPARVAIDPAAFEAYLREEGLDDALRERVERGEHALPGRERYTRHLKALIQIGARRDDAFRAIAGQELEIVPQSDPGAVAPGGKVPLAIRFRGRPLAGALVMASFRDGDGVREARYVSDAEGIASVSIDRRGAWLLHLVHMVRCDGCDDADWRSFWGAYLFASSPPGGGEARAPDMAADLSRRSRGALVVVVALAAAAGWAAFALRSRRSSRKISSRGR